MNKRKILTLAMALCMVAILAIGGTLAYFTDTDSATNVMTLGGVKIVQNETKKDGSAFEDNVPLMPRVDEEEIVFGQNHSVTDDKGEKWFNPAMKNVVDKVVTVTNTSTATEGTPAYENDTAYVRTILAFETVTEYEEGTDTVRRTGQEVFDETFGVLGKGLTWTDNMIVTVDGVEYYIAYKVYADALEPGKTTEPSLKQIFMSPDADNDDVALFNKDGKYTILALSQATQVAGFADAETALNTAFGELTAENIAAWLAEVED